MSRDPPRPIRENVNEIIRLKVGSTDTKQVTMLVV